MKNKRKRNYRPYRRSKFIWRRVAYSDKNWSYNGSFIENENDCDKVEQVKGTQFLF